MTKLASTFLVIKWAKLFTHTYTPRERDKRKQGVTKPGDENGLTRPAHCYISLFPILQGHFWIKALFGSDSLVKSNELCPVTHALHGSHQHILTGPLRNSIIIPRFSAPNDP